MKPLDFDVRQAVLDTLLRAPRPRGMALDVLAARVGAPTPTVRGAIAFLDKHGCVRRGQNRLREYERDHYLLTPAGRRVQAEGIKLLDARLRQERLDRAPSPVDADSLHARTWRAIRVLRKFSTADLLRVLLDAETTTPARYRAAQTEVGRYVLALLTHGYLANVGVMQRGRRLLLIDDTGAEPPVWVRTRDRVYDHNIGGWRSSVNERALAGLSAAAACVA